MHNSESGVSEIISAVLAVILVIALAAIIGAIFLGCVVPLPKTPYIATQATPINITDASAVQLFLEQGETVSLAPATASGSPVKFSLTKTDRLPTILSRYQGLH
ncbi:MAG: type IV pilin [Methanomicrobiales archaeon]